MTIQRIRQNVVWAILNFALIKKFFRFLLFVHIWKRIVLHNINVQNINWILLRFFVYNNGVVVIHVFCVIICQEDIKYNSLKRLWNLYVMWCQVEFIPHIFTDFSKRRPIRKNHPSYKNRTRIYTGLVNLCLLFLANNEG